MCDKNMKEETTIPVDGIETKNQRVFTYKKDCINLEFKLRTDIPDEMESFLAILAKAIKDVEDQLSIIKSKQV